MRAALILATQQFAEHPAYSDDGIEEFFFIESAPRFAKLPYHRHKIVLLVSAMRHTAARLEAEGKTVRRITLDDDLTFKAGLEKLLKAHRVTELTWMSDPNRPVDERSRASARRTTSRPTCSRTGCSSPPRTTSTPGSPSTRRRSWRTSTTGSGGAPAS